MTDSSEWRGPIGDVWAEEWRRTDRAFAGIGAALDTAIRERFAAMPVQPANILDIGCGAGATSLALAAACSGATITGLDLSAELVAVANRRRADHPDYAGRLHFHVGDALVEAPRRGPFDALVSRHGLMFFADPVAAFATLRRAATPGAPLVFSCFRDRSENPWGGGASEAVAQAPLPPSDTATGPFAFADPAHVAAILATAGWRDASPQAIDTTFRVGAGPDPVADAVGFFSRIGSAASLLRALPEADRPAARDRLAAFAARHRTGDTIDFPAAIWIWSATA